jgi:hypothetical protein
MPYSISLPSEYGYVVLTTAVGQFVVSTIMGGRVMKVRKLRESSHSVFRVSESSSN